MKYLLLGFILLTHTTYLLSQNEETDIVLPAPSNNSTLIGIGSSNMYDTYLSPLEYKGTSFKLVNEKMKKMSWFDYKFTRQQTFQFEFSTGLNPAKNAREYWFLLNYNWGGHYNLLKTDKFKLSAGALGSLSAGMLYNERNSNNPSSARLYGNINASVIAFYKLKDATFRYQIDSPFIGVLFSPNYGQSYYEMSLGNTIGTVNFASFHNQRALRNYFTVDFPLYAFTFRVGYLGDFYQTKVNNINTHNYSNSFVLGLVFESISFSGNRVKKAKFLQSSY